MDSASSNDDEPKAFTVFSSSINNDSSSKSIFDTIAFTMPKKEVITSPSLQSPPPPDSYIPTPTVAMSKTSSMVSMLADDLQFGDPSGTGVSPITGTEQRNIELNPFPSMEHMGLFTPGSSTMTSSTISTTTAHVAICVDDGEDEEVDSGNKSLIYIPPSLPALDNAEVVRKLEQLDLGIVNNSTISDSTTTIDFKAGVVLQQSEVVTESGILFQNESEVDSRTTNELMQFDHPQHNISNNSIRFETVGGGQGRSSFSTTAWPSDNVSYDFWIPTDETKKILKSIASEISAGTHVPDKDHMTMPGILLEDDLIDKVGANIGKVFGLLEASRRKTFTADNVTQDDNGIRELIKLGCYRAAINLTKRLLVLYGQGPGKIGHYSKHTPHSLQLWFTRISLLVRIREFSIAESELEAFKGFENPDMYYSYYPDAFSPDRRGSMIPFHFRLLAAEIPQYMRKFNETINKLYDILFKVQKILQNLNNGLIEDGNHGSIERREIALEIWKKREIRVLYSLTNSSIFAKDYYNAYNFLTQLCTKDGEHLAQLKSALGRLFLQHGNISSAKNYFHEASELRSIDSESEQVDTLVDSSLMAISQNNYLEAIELLKQALMIQPENFMITNNLAVCHLYMGNVKESLALMETTVKQNMPQSLQENVILNLSSIYELENSDGSKKLGLLKLISEYKGDGINLASLKIPDLI